MEKDSRSLIISIIVIINNNVDSGIFYAVTKNVPGKISLSATVNKKS